MSEDEVLAVIEGVVRRIPRSFAFGYHSVEDIRQHARMEAVVLLSKGEFDPAKGCLEGYLVRHIRRRLINLRRRVWRSDEVGCSSCYKRWLSGDEGGCGADSKDCARFRRWRETQMAKSRSFNPLPLTEGDDPAYHQPDTLVHKELFRIIDERLDPNLRAFYLRMRDGESVSTQHRLAVQEAISEILRKAGLFPHHAEGPV